MGKVYISCTEKEWNDMEDGKINVIDYKGVEYVRVVRCKDCKFYKAGTLSCSRLGLNDDDYCSWGEMKEDNGVER